MKRLMYLVIAAAAFTARARVPSQRKAARARTTARPTVRERSRSTARARFAPTTARHTARGRSVSTATVAVRPDSSSEVQLRPDDRATHGPGAIAFESSAPVRPDDRAWRGIGPAPTIVPVESTSVRADGFDWADAGIGAAGAFGLGLLLVGGAVLALRRQRVASFS